MKQKLAEIKVSYTSSNPSEQTVHCSQDAYSVLLESWDMDTIELQEEFKVLLLNKANRILGVYSLSKGGIDGTVADPRLVFVTALLTASTSIILAHNHPSGKVKPSSADRMLTSKFRSAGDVLDIKVLDHLIISKDGYFSFGDEGQ